MFPTTALTPRSLAQMIDFAFLKQYASAESIEKHCATAVQYDFWMVAIHPAEIETCLKLLAGTPVRVGATVGFPLGQNTAAVKNYETQDALQRGADEIDLVINIRCLKLGEERGMMDLIALVRGEIAALGRACRNAGATSKVILETGFLNDAEKLLGCQMCLDEGVDFVKTSSGFAPTGATVEDVRLMRSMVGNRLGVKAAGGIHTIAAARALIAAGATRLGTSRAVQIIEQLRAEG